MLLHDIKLAWRSQRRHADVALINLIGLTLALAAVLLIAGHIRHELAHDRWMEQTPRIAKLHLSARFGGEQELLVSLGSAGMAVDLTREIAQIEDFLRLDVWGGSRPVRYDNHSFIEKNVVVADSSFFRIFDFELLRGDPDEALRAPASVVISEQTAHRYFGRDNPMGRELILDNDEEQPYTVTGVMAAPRGPSHLPEMPLLLSWSSKQLADDRGWLNNVNWHSYFLLRPGVDPASLDGELARVTELYAGDVLEQMGGEMELHLQPLRDVYLHSSHYKFYALGSGSERQLRFLGLIGGFILLIALLNFINLTTARSMVRVRQMTLAKVLGATRLRLAVTQIIEATLFALTATALATLLAVLVAGPLDRMLGASFSWPLREALLASPLLLVLALLIGLLAGIYPALALTRAAPAETLGRQHTTGKRGLRLRGVLVVVQFSISIVLILATLLVTRQVHFLLDKDLGYDADQVLVVHLSSQEARSSYSVLLERLASIAGVEQVARGDTRPDGSWGNSFYHLPGTPDDAQVFATSASVGPNYLAANGMELVGGRMLSDEFSTDSSAIVINQTAAHHFGWDAPVGEILHTYDDSEEHRYQDLHVVGVVGDYHFNSLREEIRPLLMFRTNQSPGFLFVRVNSQRLAAVRTEVEKVWKEFMPQLPLQADFLDASVEQRYHSERQIARLYTLFAGLALLVASLGLFALASFTAEQRRREVSVRKVLGASETGLVGLLAGSFLRLVLLANLIAWPLAWWLTQRWLEQFAYRASFAWWAFPLAGLVSLAVALGTVSSQALRAARANPTTVLRSE